MLRRCGLKPNKKLGLECYVDADFAGSWEPDQAFDPQLVSPELDT